MYVAQQGGGFVKETIWGKVRAAFNSSKSANYDIPHSPELLPIRIVPSCR